MVIQPSRTFEYVATGTKSRALPATLHGMECLCVMIPRGAPPVLACRLRWPHDWPIKADLIHADRLLSCARATLSRPFSFYFSTTISTQLLHPAPMSHLDGLQYKRKPTGMGTHMQCGPLSPCKGHGLGEEDPPHCQAL